jgi:hypothetical protein
MRNLASIQKIKSLEPIEGKDRIELATILGWEVIVGKGEFQIGDLVVYCEYDTVLPERPEFEFLRKRCWNSFYKGFRIRNMKMGGVFSQGIVFSTDILPKNNWKEDTDVTETLGIVKYDLEWILEQKGGKQSTKKYGKIITYLLKFKLFRNLFLTSKGQKRGFPTHIVSKTDETRVQVLEKAIEDNAGLQCYVTEKLDGQSGTYAYDGKKFYVCSRNLWLRKDNNSNYWRIAKKYNLKSALKELYKLYDVVALQGEIIGPGIQKNKYKKTDLEFYVFNFISKHDNKFIPLFENFPFLNAWELNYVPFVDDGEFYLSNNVKEIVEYSKGRSMLADIPREGVVIRSVDGKPGGINKMGKWFSFKAINPDFLSKYDL